MTKKNFESILDLAQAFLYLEPESDLDGLICRHPYTDSCFVSISAKQIVDIRDPESLNKWRNQMLTVINQCETYRQLCCLIVKSYRFAWFKFSLPYLDKDDIAEFFIENWRLLENNSKNKNLSPRRLVSILKKVQDTSLFQIQKEQLANCSDPIKVYRGSSKKEQSPKGLSWTTSRKAAEYFARRFNKDGHIFCGELQKDDVLLCFLNSSEKEIICDPQKVQNVQIEDLKREGV